LLHYACDWELISRNPFRAVRARNQINTERQFFITRAMADKVMVACPYVEWKLLFALSRHGGLRCPSDLLLLVGGKGLTPTFPLQNANLAKRHGIRHARTLV
jgi:hypothetical protein